MKNGMSKKVFKDVYSTRDISPVGFKEYDRITTEKTTKRKNKSRVVTIKIKRRG